MGAILNKDVALLSKPEAKNDVDDPVYECLESLNCPQAHESNVKKLKKLGGVGILAKTLGIDFSKGLDAYQVKDMATRFGSNSLPSPPQKTMLQIFFESFNDTTLIVLIIAAVVSLVIGFYEDPKRGWMEGCSILVAVVLVAIVTTINNYSQEKQFRGLEASSRAEETALVRRTGHEIRLPVNEIVVGDVVILRAGDGVPADGILIYGDNIKSDESSLTGEVEKRAKTQDRDPFLLSSATITDSGHFSEIRMFVIAVGKNSQWGKIREKLVVESDNTPLQDKLEDMCKLIGYIGTAFAAATFFALLAMIWTKNHGKDVRGHIIEAFIIAVTIIVVAIPEGLPLAVTIALAYSTKRMLLDQNLIRVLSACETMGNATTICSDKTGTLTENQMTVVMAWFAGTHFSDKKELHSPNVQVDKAVKNLFIDNVISNNATIIVREDRDGNPLPKPIVTGSVTEGALIFLVEDWSVVVEERKKSFGPPEKVFQFPFTSEVKRSCSVIPLANGGLRCFVKGASELVLQDCTHYSDKNGVVEVLTDYIRSDLILRLDAMEKKALRTLSFAHRDFKTAKDMPKGWEEDGQLIARSNLVLDGLVGIQDPLRNGVKSAVSTAQHAGVVVRMVTGDNINTAKAIARECGILQDNGVAIEGPEFRRLTPEQLDRILPNLQVLARASPDDKFLLVTRLNGRSLPESREEWETQHPNKSWDEERDLLLPGYKAEWSLSRPNGGDIVGVTGDGTNDAPALKAADVGLSMGITGTKVAQEASDIIILDDKFSSIVQAILWGRAVYDSIRKFLQFQLTVNIVALCLVFIGSVAGFDPPLNAIMMLWVNLIMDSMGALALATEGPTPEMLQRRPYKRDASLVSWPMWRNILVQSLFQLALMMGLLFGGADMFNIHEGNFCTRWNIDTKSEMRWSSTTFQPSSSGTFTCQTLLDGPCKTDALQVDTECVMSHYGAYKNLEPECFDTCDLYSHTHFTIIFTTFVFCQVFNEFNARRIDSEWNVFKGLNKNPIFIAIIVGTIFVQILLVEGAGYVIETSHLTVSQWFTCFGFGSLSLLIGFLVRFIPIKEDENTFFESNQDERTFKDRSPSFIKNALQRISISIN